MTRILFLFCLIGTILFSQQTQANQQLVDAIGIEDQLSQSVITAIVEDQQGFLWIGTEDGLNRYDGYQIKVFQKQNSNLSHTTIHDLLIADNGDVWIATENGLNIYQQNTGKIISYHHNPLEPFTLANDYVTSLAKDDKGGVWVSTFNGPSYFDPEIEGFKTYPIMLSRRVTATVSELRKIYVDSQQRVWAVTTRGELAQFNPTSEQFFIVNVTTGGQFGVIADIAETPEGKIWLLSYQQGIVEYQPDENRFSLVHFADLGLRDVSIQASTLIFDGENNLWLGTVKEGLYSINLKTGRSNHYRYGRPGSIGSNTINCLFTDSNGILWVGTSAYLNKINPDAILFNHHYFQPDSVDSLAGDTTFALHVTQDDKLLVGSDGHGITVMDVRDPLDLKRLAIINPSTLDNKSIHYIGGASSGKAWVVTYDAVWLYNLTTQKLEMVFENESYTAELLTAHYQNGNLWLGTTEGLWRLDQNYQVTRYRVIDADFHRNNRINTIQPSVEGDNLWIGTESGVHLFDTKDMSFDGLGQLIQDLPEEAKDVVLSLNLDQFNRLWIGTFGNGLIVIDLTRQVATTINSTSSGLHDSIYSMELDANNYMWLGTGRGLYRVSPNDFSLTQFALAEDQPILEFNTGSSAKDRHGNLYFGGINGIVNFRAEAYEPDVAPPNPVITDILINNLPIVIDDEYQKRLDTLPNLANKVTFFPEDTSISFEFSGLNYADPKSNRYRYMLEGHDQDWVETDYKGRRVTYTNLKPGDYRFLVMASNKDGVWSEEPTALQIHVKTSGWLTPSAFTLYGFILGLIILAFSYLIWARMRERRMAALQLTQSEERLKLSLWGSGDELWDWQVQSGALHLSNEWPYDFPRDGIRSGYSMANSNIHPNDLPYVRQSLNAHLADKSMHYESTYRISDEHGGWIWVLDRGKVVSRDENQKPLRMAGTLKNITELKNTEQQLSMIVKSFDNISDGVWILDENFHYIAVNKAFTKITGFDESEVLGKLMKVSSLHQITDDEFYDLRNELTEKGFWYGELVAKRKDGDTYPIEINIDVVRDNDGEIINYVGVFSDITFRKQAERELRRLATVDQLTDLKNRTSFRTLFEHLIEDSGRGDQHALLFIDLDNFKRINDSLGHGIGDELLIYVAKILQEIVSDQNGVVARLGGDEFTVLLQEVDTWNKPAKIAQAILDEFAKSLPLSTAEVVVSPSIGIVMYPENGTSAEELLKNADTAMYYAKKKGKNTYQFYTRQMNEQAKLRITLESELRQAIEKDEFVMFYQPKVSLQTGKITGMEALVRWRNPRRGLVLPGEFIPLAEEAGFIIPISQRVIEKTCLQIRDWQNRGIFHGKVAVNLSAVQFYHENLWETVKNALHLAKIEPDALEFEITEGMVMEDLAQSLQQMRTLREMGISLALDDFGVGYSSLGNLKDFPIDTLKIDRTFVWDLEDSDRDRNLVASIVTLAHNLDIKVVAEGVENRNQVDALREMGCEEIQGFIFSRPVPPWDIETMLNIEDFDLDEFITQNESD
ncbi:EAL domain-containing protein [Kangiella koreensis]|uniref:cyclic-guanylate-specific phosphodiesterase n=1 Tax=Kangiella koreensis (strain DSM 16069 / JCM 12317 / KCTC 12182 / SW-125) TaxID=523791 RepID=C7R9A3_KANKD|nr:EAL domain-containing protein [Kangiella koreensis]ACV27893.1 diguanylate cyclase/phosphodiesterase with PAS/PAC sensor(s) [Kangiella koreensis DSM 16069]